MGPICVRVRFKNPHAEAATNTMIMIPCMIRPDRFEGGKCPTLVLIIGRSHRPDMSYRFLIKSQNSVGLVRFVRLVKLIR